ncbi:MAG: hypothetical protein IPO63_13330 [Bacteroidetes bacterium]|nr:hypothetical protein [Bacteroidota bacterium]
MNEPFEQVGKNGVKIVLPANALYQELPLTKIGYVKSNLYQSGIYSFLDSLKVPLHLYAKIQIPFQPIPGISMEKYLFLRVNPLTSLVEEYLPSDTVILDVLRGKIRKAGSYAVGVDTIAPSVGTVFVFTDTIDLQMYYGCIIEDGQSGIKRYRVTQNQQWKLAYYDGKSGLLRWKKSPQNESYLQFSIEVEDHCKNSTIFEWKE